MNSTGGNGQAAVREAREALKQKHAAFFVAVSELMFHHDPIGINFDDNTDEYESEAGTVIPRLGECQSVADVQFVIHQEFCRWFDESTAGQLDRYETLAQDIWLLMERLAWPRHGAA